MKRMIFFVVFILCARHVWTDDFNLTKGASRKEVESQFPRDTARTYRQEGSEEWITYALSAQELITLHWTDNQLTDWAVNDRKEIAREYLGEFCSQALLTSHPKIASAIIDVFERIPQEVFVAVTDRRRPVMITEYHTKGIGRYATSSEIISTTDDIAAMQDGLTLLKITTELEEASEPRAIKGIVAHELAHRYLEHFKRHPYSCKFEREANQLIKKWGFEEEFQLASQYFGAHTEGQKSECNE